MLVSVLIKQIYSYGYFDFYIIIQVQIKTDMV